jgi:hypothetical protein
MNNAQSTEKCGHTPCKCPPAEGESIAAYTVKTRLAGMRRTVVAAILTACNWRAVRTIASAA